MLKNNMRELSISEVKSVSGGFLPLLIGAAKGFGAVATIVGTAWGAYKVGTEIGDVIYDELLKEE